MFTQNLFYIMLRKLQMNYDPNVMVCYESYIQTLVLLCHYSLVISNHVKVGVRGGAVG
jgi:hypothetical protein